MIRLSFTGILLMGVCVLAGSLIAQDSAAKSELAKIEAYIHGLVEQNGYYQDSPNGEFHSQRDHIVFDGCNATLNVEMVLAEAPLYKKQSDNFEIKFKLGDLNPKIVPSINLYGSGDDEKLPDKREWVILRTADGGESIMVRHGETAESATSAYPLQGSASHTENLKLADALSRAITICSQKQ